MQTRCQALFVDFVLKNGCADNVSTFALTIALLIMKLGEMMLSVLHFSSACGGGGRMREAKYNF